MHATSPPKLGSALFPIVPNPFFKCSSSLQPWSQLVHAVFCCTCWPQLHSATHLHSKKASCLAAGLSLPCPSKRGARLTAIRQAWQSKYTCWRLALQYLAVPFLSCLMVLTFGNQVQVHPAQHCQAMELSEYDLGEAYLQDTEFFLFPSSLRTWETQQKPHW